MSNLYARFVVWWRRTLMRLRLRECEVCANTGTGCDCGIGMLSYEITYGRHEAWCMAYHGCFWCGRTEQ